LYRHVGTAPSRPGLKVLRYGEKEDADVGDIFAAFS
jgi:hypothetical protein